MLTELFAGPIFSPGEAQFLTIALYVIILSPGLILIAVGIRQKRKQTQTQSKPGIAHSPNFKFVLGAVLMVLLVVMQSQWSSLRTYEQFVRYDGTYYSLRSDDATLDAINVNLVGYREITTKFILESGQTVYIVQQAKSTDDDGIGVITSFNECANPALTGLKRKCELVQGLQDKAYFVNVGKSNLQRYGSKLYIDKGENIVAIVVEKGHDMPIEKSLLLAAAEDIYESSVTELFVPVLSKFEQGLYVD